MKFLILALLMSTSVFAQEKVCHNFSEGGFYTGFLSPYAEIKAGDNLIDITIISALRFYSTQDFTQKPAYILSDEYGLVSGDELLSFSNEHETSFRVVPKFEYRRKESMKWNQEYEGTPIYFPLKYDSDLPVVFHQNSYALTCPRVYLKFDEVSAPGVAKLTFRKKSYYLDISDESFAYISEDQERKWVENLKKDSEFFSVFEKIKKAILDHDAVALRALMLPQAEDEIKKLYQQYKVHEYYMDFFWEFGCNPFNLGISRLKDDKARDCETIKMEFPLVTYRTWWKEGKLKEDVVFVRFTSTEETRSTVEGDPLQPPPFGKEPMAAIGRSNQFGDQGLVLVRDGKSWKIKTVVLDNYRLPVFDGSKITNKFPNYWGRAVNEKIMTSLTEETPPVWLWNTPWVKRDYRFEITRDQLDKIQNMNHLFQLGNQLLSHLQGGEYAPEKYLEFKTPMPPLISTPVVKEKK